MYYEHVRWHGVYGRGTWSDIHSEVVRINCPAHLLRGRFSILEAVLALVMWLLRRIKTWLVTRRIMFRLRDITTTVTLGLVPWTVLKDLRTWISVVMLTVSTGLLVSNIPGLLMTVWVTVVCRVRLLDRLMGKWPRHALGLRSITLSILVMCLVMCLCG